MSFFYSQHLRDDQRPTLEGGGTALGTNPITGLSRRIASPRQIAGYGLPPRRLAPRREGCLVWHSHDAGARSTGRRRGARAAWRRGARREKLVRFSTAEVQVSYSPGTDSP